MAVSQRNPKVNFYFEKPGQWQEAIKALRKITLGCGLTEELKWGCPCYLSDGRNIVLIHVFKAYCALLFFKGALLKNTDKLLVQQTRQVQAARQIRFTSADEITQKKDTITRYIYEAIAVEEAGLKVPLKKTDEFDMPDEFRQKLADDRGLIKAFNALTPGRQRGYLLYFSSAKQAKTRISRVEKSIPRIMKGLGLND